MCQVMKEPEVSILIALHYIRNGLTTDNVKVSIDGAHIRTSGTTHFDISQFLLDNHCVKIDGISDRWQGEYKVDGYESRLTITSRPGEGDVVIKLTDGTTLFVESKKVNAGSKSHEYPAMREAIGQLMTGCPFNENIIPVVAVPYSRKSLELAQRWSTFEQIKMIGIRFILVYENGSITMI